MSRYRGDNNELIHKRQRAAVTAVRSVPILTNQFLVKCAACGSEVVKAGGKIKRNRFNYCSRACMAEHKGWLK